MLKEVKGNRERDRERETERERKKTSDNLTQ
jgi:hypothetical protein